MTINATSTDNASPGLLRFLQGLQSPEQILGGMGAAVKKLVQTHFLGLPPNKNGWATTGFYKKAARATNSRVEGNRALVTVSGPLGILQRLQGGVIKPVHAKYLAIPAREEAYGKLPGEFSNLRFEITDQGPALVEAEAISVLFGRARKNGTRLVKQGVEAGGGIMYWLRRQVDQKPDPSILPTVEEMSAVALETGKAALQRQQERSGL